jgi:hypothetical protein
MDRLIENCGAASVSFSKKELQEIEEGASKIKPSGDRYSEGSAKLINR